MRFLQGLKILIIIRIFAAIFVLLVVSLTATLAYHVRVAPVGGKLSRLIPEPGSLNPYHEAIVFAQSLDAREVPNIEPGEQAFRKAVEMMADGRMLEAHEKLTTIFNVFPNSSVAKNARRIVGDMNLDELLGSRAAHGRSVYKVRSGDSYLAIAGRHQTTIEMMIHLNSMMQLKGIQPGHELVVMPLNFRILVEPRRLAVSIWDGGRFVCEYPAISMNGVPERGINTTIKQKTAELNGGNVPSHDEAYCAASKIIQLSSGTLQIRAWEPSAAGDDDETEEIPNGILLKPQHMEEIALLTRSGNIVEIR